MLGVAGVGSAFVSDWFIHALEPAIEKLGVSQAFAGLVDRRDRRQRGRERDRRSCSPRKGQSDLAVSVVKNSVAQIAAFLFPALVLISLLFSHTLTFALEPVYIGALALTAIARVADHRRRRGGRVRGLGPRRDLRHPRRADLVRVAARLGFGASAAWCSMKRDSWAGRSSCG